METLLDCPLILLRKDGPRALCFKNGEGVFPIALKSPGAVDSGAVVSAVYRRVMLIEHNYIFVTVKRGQCQINRVE
jgi:hypothetical protein